jgi:hypothetical protein
MPLHYCHPSAPHKKLNLPEWYVSDLMLERALDAIIRRLKKLDRDHDIPYLAGYNVDGTIIYIDRHMPMSFKQKGRTIETDRFLILHEEVEKTMIDQLNLHYLHAHQIATRVEQSAVLACGINWSDYDHFMQTNVKLIGDERLTNHSHRRSALAPIASRILWKGAAVPVSVWRDQRQLLAGRLPGLFSHSF